MDFLSTGAGEAYVHLGNVAPATIYCTAKVNSQGCTPAVATQGVPSLSIADDFRITAGNVINQSVGILFWGFGPNSAPFSGGFLCVQGPPRRTAPQHSGGNVGPSDCSGSYSLHFSQGYMAKQGILAGDRIHAQYWCRDAADPLGTGLTDAAAFDVVP